MAQNIRFDLALMLAPVARGLFVTLPLIRLRLRCNRLLEEAYRSYSLRDPSKTPEAYLAELESLENRYNERNRKSTSLAKSAIYILYMGAAGAIASVLNADHTGDPIAYARSHPQFVAIIFALDALCGYFFLWTFDGLKRAPDVHFADSFRAFLAQKERERRAAEERARREREEAERAAREKARGTTGRTDSFTDALGVLGLAYPFSREQLDAARRKLALKLHPDLAVSVTPRTRRSREEKLKRVNAAYDLLKTGASA
jgi:hypothetical protein